jgi:putative endonuclease
MKGYMYILECADGSYYTGSTKNLEKRLWEHENLMGANYTKKKHPSKLVYFEEYQRIDVAFYREKQVQGWSHAKKKALINGECGKLPELAMAYRDVASRASATGASRASATGKNFKATGASRASATGKNSKATEMNSKATGASSASATGAKSPNI